MVECHPISEPIRSAEPSVEPISLDEAKRQCSVPLEVTDKDGQFRDWITQARQQVEHDARIVCYTGTFVYKLTDWPDAEWFDIPGARPISSITSIVYVAGDGTSTTWGSSNYVLDTNGTRPFVRLAYAGSWPAVRGDINGITVTYVAGYSGQTTMPQMLKDAVRLAVHLKYLEHVEQDTTKYQQAYDRQIALLRKGAYP